MLEAVYRDIWATRSVVGIQPKPPFYPLFQCLKQGGNSKVIIFDPNQLENENEKATAPDSETQSGEISGGDGGESNSPSKESYPEYTTSLISSFILLG